MSLSNISPLSLTPPSSILQQQIFMSVPDYRHPYFLTSANSSVVIYSPDIPEGSSITSTVLYRNPLVHSLIPPVEDTAHILQMKPFKQYQFFVPDGTRECWVDRGCGFKA